MSSVDRLVSLNSTAMERVASMGMISFCNVDMKELLLTVFAVVSASPFASSSSRDSLSAAPARGVRASASSLSSLGSGT